MANLSTAIVAHLESSPGVSALVGKRIWPDVPPQEWSPADGPALTYYIVSTTHEHMLNGLAGLARSRVEITAWSGARAASDAVAEAVHRSGLVGFVGDLHGVQIESVTIDTGAQHLEDPPEDGSQQHRYMTVCDYLICYQESR